MQYSSNPITDIEAYTMQRDIQQESEAQAFCDRVNEEMQSLNTFKNFLLEMDTDGHDEHAILQLFHGVKDETPEDKLFAYDSLMTLFEDYCELVAEL